MAVYLLNFMEQAIEQDNAPCQQQDDRRADGGGEVGLYIIYSGWKHTEKQWFPSSNRYSTAQRCKSQTALTMASPNPLPFCRTSPERKRWNSVSLSSGLPSADALLTVRLSSSTMIRTSLPDAEWRMALTIRFFNRHSRRTELARTIVWWFVRRSSTRKDAPPCNAS